MNNEPRYPEMGGFWVGDRSLSVLLLLLVLAIFVATPLASHAIIGSELVLATFALMAVSSVAAVSDHRPTVIAAAGIAVLSIALDWWAHFGGAAGVWFADLSLRLVFALLLGAVVTYRVFGPGNVYTTQSRAQSSSTCWLALPGATSTRSSPCWTPVHSRSRSMSTCPPCAWTSSAISAL